MSHLFVLRHVEGQHHMFSNVDSALDHLQLLLGHDADVMNYQLSKYVLDEETQQYLFDHDYDLEELVDVHEYEESDGLSYLDSDAEEDVVDSP